MMCRNIAILILFPLLGVFARAQSIVHLRSHTEPGMTVLTWQVQGGRCDGYIVYSSPTPIRNSLHLKLARRIGFVPRGQAVNARMTAILGRPVTYVLPGRVQALAPNDEFLVLPVRSPARTFYAVVPVVGGSEAPLFRVGDNTLSTPAEERGGIPQPVFQSRLTWKDRVVDHYAQWIFSDSLPGYPAMTNVLSRAVNFGLLRRGTEGGHPLVVQLHGRGSNFLNMTFGSGNPKEWILALDDEIPGKLRSTFWFGYHEELNIADNPSLFPTSGTIEDYTVRRVVWTVQWVLSSFPIDRDRVLLSGVSMGGSGALWIGYSHPSLFSAIRAQIPRVNYAVEKDPNLGSGTRMLEGNLNLFSHLWGKPAARLTLPSGLPVWLRQNLGEYLNFLPTASVPPALIVSGRKDTNVGWFQNIGVLAQMEALHLGALWIWEPRGHTTPTQVEYGDVEALQSLARYRRQRSWPAITAASSNAQAGTGLVSDGDSVGQWNAQVDWMGPLVDEPDLWAVTLLPRDVLFGARILPAPDTVLCQLTPKRLQRFLLQPGQRYECRVYDGEKLLGTQVAMPDKRRDLTFSRLKIASPVRVEIRPLSPSDPSSVEKKPIPVLK